MVGRLTARGAALAVLVALLILGGVPVAGRSGDEPALLWQASLPSGPNMLAAAGDTVVLSLFAEAGETSATVMAVAAADGAARWRVTLGPELASVGGLAIEGDTVYVVGYDVVSAGLNPVIGRTDLVAFDLATGTERWRVTLDGGVPLAPVVADGTLFLPTEDGLLLAFDAAAGRERWRTQAESASPAVVANGTLVVLLDARSASQRVVALDAAGGTERWSHPTRLLTTTAPLVIAGDLVAIVGFDGVEVVRLADGGRVASSGRPAYYEPYSAAADAAGPVIKAEVPGTERSDWERSALFALDAATAGEQWCTLVEEPQIAAPPRIAAGSVIVPGERHLTGLDRTTGEARWRIETGLNPRVQAVGDVLYVADLDRDLAAYRLTAPAAGATPGAPERGAGGPLGSCPRTRTTGTDYALGAGLGLAFLIPGLIYTGFVMRNVRWALASKLSWPRTTGRVTASWVQHYWRAGYYAHVTYTYVVNGVTYAGTRVRFLPLMSHGEAQEVVAAYPPGAEVEVRYHPTRPKNATLQSTLSPFAVVLAFAIAAALVGFGVAFLGALL